MSDKRILIFGKTGQLGWELQRTLAPLGEVHAFGPDQLDLTNLKALEYLLHETKPHVIVNASAYTAVDRAEEEKNIFMLLNAPGSDDDGPKLPANVKGDTFVHY